VTGWTSGVGRNREEGTNFRGDFEGSEEGMDEGKRRDLSQR
jgi:hypothetical protein